MADENEPVTMSYVADMDPAAYVRVVRKHWRRQWRSRLRRYVGFVATYALVGGLSASVGSTSAGAEFSWRVMRGGAIFAAVVAVIFLSITWDESRRKLSEAAKPQSWQCAITDASYSITDESGITFLIPWAAMRVEIEDPEAWFIGYSDTDMIVFRKSLRNVNLEEEFRSRVGSA